MAFSNIESGKAQFDDKMSTLFNFPRISISKRDMLK